MTSRDPEFRELQATPGAESDLAPLCDRCGKPGTRGGAMDIPTLRAVCFDCLTMVEKRCLDLGVSPFEPADE